VNTIIHLIGSLFAFGLKQVLASYPEKSSYASGHSLDEGIYGFF
jgi:hypothetical protein